MAQYDPNDPEDTRFCESSPSGDMRVTINNPNLVGTFNPGEEYYIDLIPVKG